MYGICGASSNLLLTLILYNGNHVRQGFAALQGFKRESKKNFSLALCQEVVPIPFNFICDKEINKTPTLINLSACNSSSQNYK